MKRVAILLGVSAAIGSIACAPPVVFSDGPSEIRLAPGEDVVLDGSGSFDPFGDKLSHVWRQIAGPPAELRDATTPWPRFVPTAPGRYEFELVVSAGDSGEPPVESPPARIAVMVLPPNRPPTIEVDRELQAEPGQWVVLDAGRTSDPDGDIVTFEWRQVRGEYALMEPKTGRGRRVRVRAWKLGEYAFMLTARDAFGAEATAEVCLKVAPRRVPPSALAAQKSPGGEAYVPVRLTAWPHASGGANGSPVARVDVAGPDEDGLVVVDAGGSSDPDGDDLSFRWRQISGPLVRTLFGAGADGRTMSRVEFDPPSGGSYCFELVVSDGTLSSPPVRATVDVDEPRRDVPFAEHVGKRGFPVDARPSRGVGADAGRDQVTDPGVEVTLDGSRSRLPGRGRARYAWRQTDGPRIREFRLSSIDDEARPRFIPTEPGRYEFALRISADGLAWSVPSYVTVNVLAPNRPPTLMVPAHLTVRPQRSVIFAASAGDPDGDAVRVRWRRVGGARVRLAAAGTRVGFIAPASGHVVLEATCVDGRGARTRRVSRIHVATDGPAPVASACVREGGQAHVGERVILDGGDSYDPLGERLTYSWDVAGQSLVRLRGTERPVASFVPQTPGTYLFELIVSARGLASGPVLVAVDVDAVAAGPMRAVVRPVPRVVTVGRPVVLDASLSRRGAALLPVRWSQVDGPSVKLPGLLAPRVVVEPRRVGTYEFEAHCPGAGMPARVRFDAVKRNRPPEVRARAKMRGPRSVVLDGRGSRDVEGAPLSYRWIHTGGEYVGCPAISGADSELVLSDLESGEYRVRLLASDGERVSRSEEVCFTVPERKSGHE